MRDIVFKDLRFNPEISSFNKLAEQMAKGFGYQANLITDKYLAQLIRLRIAQKNKCSYCTILHAEVARELGIPAAKVDHISSWWNSGLFTPLEKVVLEYCDALTAGSHENFQQYHDAMLAHFSAIEIADIAAIVINMNVWTRWKLAQGQTPFFK